MTNEQRDEKIGEIHTAVMVMSKSVKDHGAALFGNGRPGLKERTTVLEQKMKAIEGIKIDLNGISKKVDEVSTKQARCKGGQVGKKQQLMVAIALISCGITFFSMVINYLKLSAL